MNSVISEADAASGHISTKSFAIAKTCSGRMYLYKSGLLIFLTMLARVFRYYGWRRLLGTCQDHVSLLHMYTDWPRSSALSLVTHPSTLLRPGTLESSFQSGLDLSMTSVVFSLFSKRLYMTYVFPTFTCQTSHLTFDQQALCVPC